MKNLSSVFVAYLAGWAIFFGYALSLGMRLRSLGSDIERLKKQLKSK